MGKKLTESALKTAFNKKFSQRKLIVDVNGSNYEVLVDEHVQQTKLEDLFTELFQKYEMQACCISSFPSGRARSD
jgi:UDP-N-acetylglucosamine transferase subunit ALG13